MTFEDKELVFKDICARLPYGVKVESVFLNTDTKNVNRMELRYLMQHVY